MLRHLSLLLVSVLLGTTLLQCGCGKKVQPDSAVSSHPRSSAGNDDLDAGHQQMLDQLARIKSRVPDENLFLGDIQLRRLRQQLSTIPPRATAQRAELSSRIGIQEIFHGDTRQGINKLQDAYQTALTMGDTIPEDAVNHLLFNLGVAQLRLAETENCVEGHTNESCIFPIRGSGVHVRKEGATKAIEYYMQVLQSRPDHLPTRWLLNVAYMTVGRYPDDVPERFLIPPSAFESEQEFPRFVDRASDLGLNTFSLAGGCVVDDFDADGFLDIIVSSWDPAGQIRFYRNDGDGTFTDRTEESGLLGIFGGLNVIQADYDNDADIDVLVLRGGWLADSGQHPNSLLQNDGKGRFRDVTFAAGLGRRHYPTQTASWADYDNDGDLDLYVGNERFANQLFQNRGDGTFTDVAATALVNDHSHTKGVVWGDFDNDRFPDLYVSNMEGENRLFRNNGNGTFTDVAGMLGVDGPRVSFPLWFWDYNNDGALDIFVASFWQDVGTVAANYLGMPHEGEMDCLYEGDGEGRFHEVAKQRNLHRVTQPMGSNFGDLDNDGYLDFYLGTGFPPYEALVPNMMFRNERGERFLDVTTAGGFGHLQKGHGVAFADLDNDGDKDIFHELGGWYAGDAYGDALFVNPGFGNHWITLKLVGTDSNSSAIGSRIRIDLDQPSKRSIYRWVNSGGSFGGNPLRQQIGIGKADRIARLEIFWPTTGKTQVFTDLACNKFFQVTENSAELRELPWSTVELSDVKRDHDHDSHQHHGVHHDHDHAETNDD